MMTSHLSCQSLPLTLQHLCPTMDSKSVEFSIALALRNYAAGSDGSRILPNFAPVTPPSPPRSSWWGRLLPDAPVSIEVLGEPSEAPLSLLDGRLEPCWSVSASRGYLAIRLAECSTVTKLLLGGPRTQDASSNPQDVVIWGVVDGSENVLRLQAASVVLEALHSRLPALAQAPPSLTDYPVVPIAVVRLENVTGPQSFDIMQEIIDLKVDFGLVVVEILSNWGGNVTEMCTLGVYGP